MCEPSHSIIQYPEYHDDMPVGPKLEALKPSWLEKIHNWFHVSKLGSGHSEAMSMNRLASRMLPAEHRYDGNWWDRTVRPDHWHPDPDAVAAATKYCNRVCMGSISTLRRFLEISMKASDRPYSYAKVFVDKVLNLLGQTEFRAGMKRFFTDGKNRYLEHDIQSCYTHHSPKFQKAVNFMMGFTRKPKFLRDQWSMTEGGVLVPGQ